MKITSAILLLFLVYLPVFAQSSPPRGTPQSEKVSSQTFGQFILVLSEQDAAIIPTSETNDL